MLTIKKKFETYGEDLQYIESLDPHMVATLVDTDAGERLATGLHMVNRICYYELAVPWTVEAEYEEWDEVEE